VGDVAAAVAVAVGVLVVADAVGTGRVVASLGVGVPGGEAVACDREGFALVGETDAGAAGSGALLTGGTLLTGESPGDAPPGAPVSPVAGVLAEPDEAPPPAAAGRGECDPVSASTVTIPVAMIATRTPTTAMAPDSATIRRRGARIACGKPLGRNVPARSITSRR
jgi:hypothetical protein